MLEKNLSIFIPKIVIMGFIDPVSLGIAALIGGGVGLGSALSKKKTSSSQYIPGTQPYQSAYEVPGFTPTSELVTRRMQGADVGLPQTQLDRYSSPVISQLNQRYQDYTKPQTESELSSRGINYSPIAADISRRGYMESVEQPTQSFLSDLNYKNELLKRQEIADAINTQTGQLIPFAQNVRTGAYNAENQQAQQRYAIDQGNQTDIMTPITQGLTTAGNIYGMSTAPDYSSLFSSAAPASSATSPLSSLDTPSSLQRTINTQTAPGGDKSGLMYNLYRQLYGR